MTNKVNPFSRAQNPNAWQYHNCRLCPKGYKREEGEGLSMARTVRLVGQGKECRHKGYLDHFAQSAKVPLIIAEELGYRGKDKGLPDQCPLRPWASKNPPKQGNLFGPSSNPYSE